MTGVAWNLHGALGVVALTVSLGLAAFVLSVRHGSRQNPRLATLLAIDGLVVGSGFGFVFLSTTAGAALQWERVHGAAVTLLPAAYVGFLATLDTPLTRPLHRRAVRLAVWLVLGAVALIAFVQPSVFIAGIEAHPTTRWVARLAPAAGGVALLNVVAPLYGLAAAASQYRRAPSGAARERAKVFLVAFGGHDVLQFLLLVPVLALPGSRLMELAQIVPPLNTIALVSLLSYGILRTQLFGIELRVKATLRRALVAGPIVAAFFVAEQVAQSWVQGGSGSFLVGLGAAAVAGLAFSPLRSLADRAVERMMPGVGATPTYLDARREAVYLDALEALWGDGALTPKERTVLERLGAKLGIDARDAQRLEDVVRARAPRMVARPPPGAVHADAGRRA